ncbi:MAG: hypothetical protein NZ699_08310 [Roseiflexus sp.]|nr:hypothetical protein [Roseiflexus sp.]MCS7289119.1 hypothetical protein [Roseiflexus sp.]MDW8144708.1 hypothetical protein [Roseiflexaceae bacterium]MDW8233263.1 hypothetical protein [Roseiflexaceae bacterium]
MRHHNARAEAFIARALAIIPPDNQAGIVVFGREALVERMPSLERTFGAPAARPIGSATLFIADALNFNLGWQCFLQKGTVGWRSSCSDETTQRMATYVRDFGGSLSGSAVCSRSVWEASAMRRSKRRCR